jgi:hypothetical protein
VEREQFWQEFDERFGPLGRDPIVYYCYELGHILSLRPDEMGEITPADMLGALDVFDSLYKPG